MLKKDNVAEYGDLATNNLGHSLKVVNGFEIVTFGGKKVFDVRETIGQTVRLANAVADSATMCDLHQMKNARWLQLTIHEQKFRQWDDFG